MLHNHYLPFDLLMVSRGSGERTQGLLRSVMGIIIGVHPEAQVSSQCLLFDSRLCATRQAQKVG